MRSATVGLKKWLPMMLACALVALYVAVPVDARRSAVGEAEAAKLLTLAKSSSKPAKLRSRRRAALRALALLLAAPGAHQGEAFVPAGTPKLVTRPTATELPKTGDGPADALVAAPWEARTALKSSRGDYGYGGGWSSRDREEYYDGRSRNSWDNKEPRNSWNRGGGDGGRYPSRRSAYDDYYSGSRGSGNWEGGMLPEWERGYGQRGYSIESNEEATGTGTPWTRGRASYRSDQKRMGVAYDDGTKLRDARRRERREFDGWDDESRYRDSRRWDDRSRGWEEGPRWEGRTAPRRDWMGEGPRRSGGSGYNTYRDESVPSGSDAGWSSRPGQRARWSAGSSRTVRPDPPNKYFNDNQRRQEEYPRRDRASRGFYDSRSGGYSRDYAPPRGDRGRYGSEPRQRGRGDRWGSGYAERQRDRDMERYFPERNRWQQGRGGRGQRRSEAGGGFSSYGQQRQQPPFNYDERYG